MEQLKKSLLWAYYLCWAFVVIVAVGAFLLSRTNNNVLIHDETTITTIKSILIIFVLASVPFALWYHHRVWKQLTDGNTTLSKVEKMNKYKNVSLLRIGLITFGTSACILFCYLMVQRDLLYLALIAAVAMIFCKPSAKQSSAELDALLDEGDNNKND
ncbi:MAG: hypothetical protein Q4D14_03530 [Bacteroidales bacterium]|nr:hypothetical protein [Bacteroidales bacterium]